MEYSNLFVCLMGICTVFIGLICIIVLVSVMSNIVRRTDRKMKASDGGASAAVSAGGASANASAGRAVSAGAGEVTAELVAAVSAVIAEEMGTDASGIRIVSFKKVSA